MRLLFVSNLFPPFARGGYELWCDEVATALSKRGHTLAVLTAQVSQASIGREMIVAKEDAKPPFAVHRLLHTEVEGGLAHTMLRLLRERQRLEHENLAFTKSLIEEFRPDAVLIWGMWNIARSVPQQIESQAGSHVAYYLSDYWPTLPSAYVQKLQEPARRAHLQALKSLVGRYFLPRLTATSATPLRFENPICVSCAVRDILVERGVGVAHAQIIAGGTALGEFEAIHTHFGRKDASVAIEAVHGSLRLLYLGRLDRTKGVHTLIEAMQLLSSDAVAILDIVGAGEEDYVADLRAMVAEGNLGNCVRFLGVAQRSDVPAVLSQYDVLVFPSEWEEPFGRSVVEAMATGLCVIGTTTGGVADILIEGKTGLTYPVGDAKGLSAQIRRLAADPLLRQYLGESGHKHVLQHFTLTRMVDELEAALHIIAGEPLPSSRS